MPALPIDPALALEIDISAELHVWGCTRVWQNEAGEWRAIDAGVERALRRYMQDSTAAQLLIDKLGIEGWQWQLRQVQGLWEVTATLPRVNRRGLPRPVVFGPYTADTRQEAALLAVLVIVGHPLGRELV
jgi:hypothetical protein